MNTTIQITDLDTIFSGTKETLEEMKKKFDQDHYIKLPSFIEPNLLKFVQHQINQSEFYKKKYKIEDEDITDCRLKNKSIDSLLRFLINDQKLFQLIQIITGCSKVESFTGTVLRMTKDYGNCDLWHNDMADNHMIAISINLSTEVYGGGIFEMRDCNSGEVLHKIKNIGFGDGILFQVSPSLEHRVTNVEGLVNRTIFAGWFRSELSYISSLRNRISQTKNKLSEPNTTISKHSTFVAKKELFSRIFNDQVFIFNLDNATCCELNPLANEILNLLYKPTSRVEIQNEILNKFDVEQEQCKQDVSILLQEMLSADLITPFKNKDLINPSSLEISGVSK